MARIMRAIVQPDILRKADRAEQHEPKRQGDETRSETLR